MDEGVEYTREVDGIIHSVSNTFDDLRNPDVVDVFRGDDSESDVNIVLDNILSLCFNSPRDPQK